MMRRAAQAGVPEAADFEMGHFVGNATDSHEVTEPPDGFEDDVRQTTQPTRVAFSRGCHRSDKYHDGAIIAYGIRGT